MNTTTEVAVAEKKAMVRDTGMINRGADSGNLAEAGMAFAVDVAARCGSLELATFAT